MTCPTRRIVMAAATVVLTATGCITVNVPIGGDQDGAAAVHEIRYEAPADWQTSSGLVVRVKDFSAVQGLQRSEMVVELEDGTISRASTDVWSGRPMELLPDLLSRDMIAAGAWRAVLRHSTMVPEDMVVDGYVRYFGGVESATGRSARLDIDVVVYGPLGELMMQRNYRYDLELPEATYPALADGMATLVQIWSEEVMGDLWSLMLPVR